MLRARAPSYARGPLRPRPRSARTRRGPPCSAPTLSLSAQPLEATPLHGPGRCLSDEGSSPGYLMVMTEMADHDPRIGLEGVPEGEDIDAGDAAERVDEEPEEQENRVDPVWSETRAGDEDESGR
jgi:hypothetical protein